MRGGGLDIMDALVAAAVVLGIATFIWFMDTIGKDWSRLIDMWPDDAAENARAAAAEAMVPELAAARNMPDYAGRCRCAACRKRTSEPCSDYDGV